MSAPLCTPLLLASAYNKAVNQAEGERLLAQIVHASSLLQGACHRRFDEYAKDERFTAKYVVKGGDLLDDWCLDLNADLRSVTTLEIDIPFGSAIGSGTAVTTYDILSSEDVAGSPANSGRELALDEFSGSTFLTALNPRKSIGVRGVWGFGGQWVNSGATVSGLVSDVTVTTATVANSTNIEAGQVWKIGSEYLYVETFPGTTATVSRAYNGSTAAVHADASVIYYWEAHPLIQKLIRRLVQWDEKQKESPMVQNVAVGDFSFPAATDGLPKDVFDTIYQARLVALPDRIVKA